MKYVLLRITGTNGKCTRKFRKETSAIFVLFLTGIQGTCIRMIRKGGRYLM